MNININTHIHIHTHTHTHTHTLILILIHIHIHTHSYIYTCTYTYTYIYIFSSHLRLQNVQVRPQLDQIKKLRWIQKIVTRLRRSQRSIPERLINLHKPPILLLFDALKIFVMLNFLGVRKSKSFWQMVIEFDFVAEFETQQDATSNLK